MSKGSGGSGSRLSRCIRAPVRALGGIRDLYVRAMSACAGKVGQYSGSIISYPSYSTSSDLSYGTAFDDGHDDDLRQLIRAASKARQQQADVVRRSQSVAVGRIDEDGPCEFEEVRVGSSLLFPRRSRSTARGVGIKNRGSKSSVFA